MVKLHGIFPLLITRFCLSHSAFAFCLKLQIERIHQKRTSSLRFLSIMIEDGRIWTGGAMDRLRTLRTFICVAEHASFAEAGRRLNMSPTTVTRTIAALEKSLGVQLLMRTTRSVRLTEEGALFLERCRDRKSTRLNSSHVRI